MKPKMRDHYHSHRLSFWLKLIPGLHQPTPDDDAVDIDGGIYLRHHLLVDHENPSSYDGIVRQIALKFLQPAPTAPSPSVQIQKQLKPQQATQSSDILLPHLKQSSKTSSNSIKQNDDIYKETISISGVSVVQNSPNNKTNSPASMTRNKNQNYSNTNQGDSYINQSDSYTTALSVTIAIGCSLLVLNMLIFAGVYYQLERAKKRENSSERLTVDKPNTLTRSSGHTHHHHLHSLEV